MKLLRVTGCGLLCLFASACSAYTQAPVITKIDPPNWFTHLPDSLLLVHGEHLEQTTFTLRNSPARIAETTISPNGHWAFLTFVTANATPGTFEIVASNRHGSTSFAYTLSARRPVAQQPRGFNSADVMYLIMPDRFADGDLANDKLASFREPDDRSKARAYHGGDLRGIQDHLDYLEQLGVSAIWTTPLYDNTAEQSGQSYHGYSATDMFAVDPHLGTMADYRALVEAAHARGIKIVLDTVPNHIGAAHPWVMDEPTPDWFHGTASSHLAAQYDFSTIVDPNAPPAARTPVVDGWFADRLPDLNQDNPLVAQYLLQNAIWWIEMAGIDGLRIDTFPYVQRSFWQGYDSQLHALYPQLRSVGEIENGDARITSFFAGGRANTGSDGTFDTALDTPFDYPMYYALRGALTHRKPMSAIADVLAEDALYPHPERLVTFFGNHDQERFLSAPGASPAAMRLAYGLLATMRGTPQLYYGDEVGMTGGEDPDNRKDFPGGFAHDPADAFTPAGRSAAQQSMHDWVATLMQLRRHTAALETGLQQTLLSSKNIFAFTRGPQAASDCAAAPAADRFVIVVNDDTAPQDVCIPLAASNAAGCMHFVSLLHKDHAGTAVNGTFNMHLEPQQIEIFRAQP